MIEFKFMSVRWEKGGCVSVSVNMNVSAGERAEKVVQRVASVKRGETQSTLQPVFCSFVIFLIVTHATDNETDFIKLN